MRHTNPQTEEQEAENAAYIARECERIRSTWSENDVRVRRIGPGEAVELHQADVDRIYSLALKALQRRMERRLNDSSGGRSV